MNKSKLILVLGVFLASLYGKSGACWDIRHRAFLQDAELENKIIFSFKDAKTCKPVIGADVSFYGDDYTTNKNGHITLAVPKQNVDRNIPLVVKKDTYITLEQNVQAMVGSFWQNTFLLTKYMPIKSARFILAWSNIPKDLDLHLVSDDFHISYRNKKGSYSQAKLDRDSTNGYGAETITLDVLDKDKTYKVLIHKYSSSGKLDHNVNFSLYKNNKLDKSFSLGDNIQSSCVQVAVIRNNKVKYDVMDVDSSNCVK